MSKYTQTPTRSRRKARHPDPRQQVSTTTISDGKIGRQLTLPFDPRDLIDETFAALTTEIGLTVMEGLLEDEAEQLAGPKHARRDGLPVRRHGHEDGSVCFAGKRLAIRRPRLRDGDREVALSRYGLFQSSRRLRDQVKRTLLAQVSTRRYERVVDDLAEGYGIRKSSISRHWRAATVEELAGLLARPLGDLDLVAILIDGIHFQDHLLVVALGIASDGHKHVLGLWEGDTENTATVTGLLTSLRDRGLDISIPHLFVIDGSKALAKGIRSVFGERAPIQRCLVHKLRNVLDALPKTRQWRFRAKLRAAYDLNDLDAAQQELECIHDELLRLSAPSAASLREDLAETLTLHRLGVPPAIRSRLNTTYAIENLFANVRRHTRRVRNWNSAPDMRERWAATALLDAEKSFHRLKNHALLVQVMNLLTTTAYAASYTA